MLPPGSIHLWFCCRMFFSGRPVWWGRSRCSFSGIIKGLGRYGIFAKSAPVGSWNTRRPNWGIIARM